MARYTVANLKDDVEDQAPQFGLAPDMEGRFARRQLGLEQSGISYQRLGPGFRIPFGHTHEQQEEIYVVLSGAGRAKIDDDMVDLRAWDAVRVAPGAWRAIEAGPDGIELLAFGARPGLAPDEQDTDMEQGWWKD